MRNQDAGALIIGAGAVLIVSGFQIGVVLMAIGMFAFAVSS